MNPAELTILADPGITKELRGIVGVAQVTVSGGDDRTIAVNVRPPDLAAAHVSVADVVNALNSQNLAAPVGERDRRPDRAADPAARPAAKLRRIFSSSSSPTATASSIRLGQVAEVNDTAVEARSLAFLNGLPGIGLDITKTQGVSTTRVADDIKGTWRRSRRTLPAGVQAHRRHATPGVRVRNSVRNVEEALVEGALLTVLVVFLFLNSWRSTVITGLALPVSTIAAFIAVYAFGFTLNTMSLLGLSLAIGILIDDAIVVRENIVRHIELGEDHLTASHNGTDEIGLAVAATTFSIVAVFVPVAFMNGIAGQWFKPFALTIACAVLVSLFVSFSLDPMLSAYWPDPQIEAHERRNPLARALDRFNNWFDQQADRYKARDRVGARPPLVDGGARGALVRGRDRAAVLRRRGRVHPDSDRSEFDIAGGDAAGLEPRLHAAQARRDRRIVRAHPRGRLHVRHRRAMRPDRARSMTPTSTCGSCPSRPPPESQNAVRRVVRGRVAPSRAA